MKQLLALLILFSLAASAQDGRPLLQKLHIRYRNGPCKAYTFSQKNTHYRNDSVIGKSVWHEAVMFPDKFRISFDSTGKNYVVFRNDSVYRYIKGALKKSGRDTNSLLLLLGGMYYRDFNDVATRLIKSGFNIDVLSTQPWESGNAWVFGAQAGDMKSNQFWVDQSTMRVVRIIEKMDKGDMMDMRFEAFQQSCGGFTETRVSFRRNGKLEQVEEYYNIKQVEGFVVPGGK